MVTAHELAHQYWAHQLVAADTEGASVLSETLAQYSAMMVVKSARGEDQIRRHLQYELDRYLDGRANGRKEPPLVADGADTETPLEERIEVGLFTAEPGRDAFDESHRETPLATRNPQPATRKPQLAPATRAAPPGTTLLACHPVAREHLAPR